MLPPPEVDEVEYVSPNNIRRMFNESQYPSMIANGLLLPEEPYLRNAHLKEPQKVGEPYCTHGQTIRYSDKSGQWFVVVFQYLRADKTIGASGRPDPKRLRVGNKIFIVDTQGQS